MRPKAVIRYGGWYYVLAASSLADDRIRVLKHGDSFAVFDRYGDIVSRGAIPHGIFHGGTRYLSHLELHIDGTRPLLLSSSVLKDNTLLAVDLANQDIVRDGKVRIPRGVLHIFRTKFLWQGACFEKLKITNYGQEPITTSLSMSIDGDFADIFEARGMKRRRRGTLLPPHAEPSGLRLGYTGLDRVKRRCHIHWRAPESWPAQRGGAGRIVNFRAHIPARSTSTMHLTWSCTQGARRPPRETYEKALADASAEHAELRDGAAIVDTSNEQFNDWLNRSYSDIHMMTTKVREGYYPYAGVPWFDTVFGRDGIWTAYFFLWIDPKIARGVLAHLAYLQAKASDAARDAEAGKILHETRHGEMAGLQEVPFGLYYGSVDSTPLFVMLAGAYLERTGDLEFARWLWPHVQAAMAWIRDSGDRDGDGFVEYHRRSKRGLVNQGWKDSDDSVFHRDGTLASGSIALCEVQGYVYEAYRRAAAIAARLGRVEHARHYDRRAETLRAKFETAFWAENLGSYALALDGRKRACRVRSSNAGHLLFCGIASKGRAQRTARTLMAPDSFSGWGIRTIAEGEALFNPMSYHNGSVWPHDNAIIAHGMARYGLKAHALRVMQGLFEASVAMDLNRLPELFCGFRRRPAEGPTLYPVACSPQSWASASPFMLLQSALGLSIDAANNRISFDHPVLPAFLREVRIRDLRAGGGSVDVVLTRHREDVSVNVMRRSGPVELVALK